MVQTRSMSVVKKRKRNVNLPPNVTQKVANFLNKNNFFKLYMASPKHMRNAMEPKRQKYIKVGRLRSKLTHDITRTINPTYIRIVKRLEELNNTPNNYYNLQGKVSTGWHSRRVKRMINNLNQLRPTADPSLYMHPNGRYYNYNRGSLSEVPTNPFGGFVEVAKGLRKNSATGKLSFNMRTARERRRRM